MSRPTALDLPENASAHRLETARGSFAVLDAAPSPDAPARGTALLVPGFTGSKEDFLPLLAPLSAAGFRVVSVDGRGQYESGGPREEGAYAQRELAADVVAQSAALAAGDGSGPGGGTGNGTGGGPLHLLGHSLGGLIVRDAVITHGTAAWASLTLMSSGPAAISEEQQARTRLLIDVLPVMDLEAIWQAMRSMDVENGEQPDTPPAVEDFLHRRWTTTLPEQLAATARQLMEEPDRVAELAAAGPLPKMVISGEVDHAWPVPWLDAMAVRLGAERAVIKGAEHSPNTERPAETAAALIDFWQSLTGE
ncbi:Pimeloyl-ACP methyl ester carboxylesterase [Actinacidiphila alni]|uniref:Pimeloyl-ACP methyl ester carboxylesterase n=1 Tax=Actinacidiphila alni TaxID=380248 RepID=A0A1I2L6A3_9ACTN|nr:alpha/beta fold hydrolase [Actinacidiphila alni]SFF72781.1 Pimeloyl-ACP methyl ester carboxylesterase [Actinacidiphila alni]